MPQKTPLAVRDIASASELIPAVQVMDSEPAIALDTESDSFFHFPEQICLVQVATSRFVAIIDPIAFSDLTPLAGLLANPAIQKVLHGADYDVRSIDRAWGFPFANLYDTYIAARFAGITQVGLAALAESLLGVTLNKTKSLQRADWSRRPLSRQALEYAANDVTYLLAIRDSLDERLRLLGRTTWVAEEFKRLEEIRYTPPDPDKAFLAVKGSWNLSPRGLAVLRALFTFREQEATRQNRPPFYFLRDQTLIFIAANPKTDLAQVPDLSQVDLRRFGRALQQAIDEGMDAPPIYIARPEEVGPTPQQLVRLQKLKAWRSTLGQRLSMDPSLIWGMTSLERLTSQPDTLDEELTIPSVRAWQRQEFSASLRAVLATI